MATYSIGCRSQFPVAPRLSPFAKQGMLFEARATEPQQHDPWPIIVDGTGRMLTDTTTAQPSDTVYVFYAYWDGTYIGISYASCSLADYLIAPTNLVRHGSWVVAPDPGGLGDVYHTAPCVFQRPDGSWRMLTHIFQDGRDRGFSNYCSALEFPGTWHKGQITIDVDDGLGEGWIHPESYEPPETSPSGLWECIYATCPAGGVPWVGRRATSADDGNTWVRRGVVMNASGSAGEYDSTGIHPIGKIHVLSDGVRIGTDQGYNDATWRPGIWSTRDYVRFYKSPYGSIWQPNPAAGSYDHGSIEAPSLFFLPGGRIDIIACTSLTFTASPGTGGGTDYQIAWATLTP